VAYLIDSDWTIDHLNNVPEAVNLVQGLIPEGVFISAISYLEAFEGTLREANSGGSAANLTAFASIAPVLDIGVSVAERCAELRNQIRLRGRRIESRAFDLLIAATAIEYDLTLVTRNVRDYADIPGLKLYQPQRP
jgi:predicted nucleic acid-binding protein